MIREADGICWPQGGTVGCITVAHNDIKGVFPGSGGDDARICCDILPAGKYRNGAARSWCRSHQQYWGIKADLAVLATYGVQRCARHAEPMGYVLNPTIVDLADYHSVTLQSPPSGLIDMEAIALGPDAMPISMSSAAFAIRSDPASALFRANEIRFVHITAIALAAYHQAVTSDCPTGCIDCTRCGHPHLDLGEFSMREHKRHYCGNCGNDSTHSPVAIISNPLFALFRFYREKLDLTVSNVHPPPLL